MGFGHCVKTNEYKKNKQIYDSFFFCCMLAASSYYKFFIRHTVVNNFFFRLCAQHGKKLLTHNNNNNVTITKHRCKKNAPQYTVLTEKTIILAVYFLSLVCSM